MLGCKRQKPPTRVRIWLGPSNACNLQKTGTLECWGANEAGQVGDHTTIARAFPAVITDAGRPDEVAIGARHMCALTGSSVRCWGDGTHAQLTPGLSADSRVEAIGATGDTTCVQVAFGPGPADHGVRCWGSGVGNENAPPALMLTLAGSAKALAVGASHVCATVRLPTNANANAVLCSGADDRGQSAGKKPILVGATVVGLAAGPKHSCALLEDGSVQCWGANDQGQLGDGTTTDSHVPALVSALPAAVEIRAGATHTCARLRSNTVACWGGNAEHQLANGTTTPSSKPLPVPGLLGVVELALAGDSACARMSEGDVRCWGANASGQLGDGSTTPHEVPMPVRSPPAPK